MVVRRRRVVARAVLSSLGSLTVDSVLANDVETGSAPESGEVALQSVTVTAQRRAENSQSVPIDISTVSAEDAQLRGAVSLQTLSTTVPNLTTTGSQGTSIFIRGVGNTSASASDEPSAATYIDGVYMPSTFGLIGYKFNNIERVEVLKGPQGTLFGRNATAGVIQIITPDPKHDFQGNADVGYANFNTIDADAYLTGGLTDTLAADLALLYENQMDGWGHDLTTGNSTYRHKNHAARSKWLYTPTESTKVNFTFDYSNFWYDSGTQLAPGPSRSVYGSGAGI
jgi:iron complex outermembrane recepter protein